jgi:hypothetical protein
MDGKKFSLQANTDTNQVLAKPKSNADFYDWVESRLIKHLVY